MKKRILLICTILCVSLFGCVNKHEVLPEKPLIATVTAGLIVCAHKYDTTRKFSYLKINSTLHKIDDKLSVYDIVDVNNKHWYLNNFEIINYSCTQEK